MSNLQHWLCDIIITKVSVDNGFSVSCTDSLCVCVSSPCFRFYLWGSSNSPRIHPKALWVSSSALYLMVKLFLIVHNWCDELESDVMVIFVISYSIICSDYSVLLFFLKYILWMVFCSGYNKTSINLFKLCIKRQKTMFF